jgi:pimeloyl-ACP methyl ester carboxylesterase
VLVGHSYGGAVITAAGTDGQVAALGYVCAFAPDNDELDGSFAADVPADVAGFMADSQVPWGVDALGRAGSRVVEVDASQSVYVSQPAAVASLVHTAGSTVVAQR